jgi:hydroxysqualene dehydroxylase
MNDYNILILGSGLSGLSAAVELCARGYKVLVLEQHQYPGGRTYSFIDAATGDSVDNGQHVMLGCYHAARRYMRIIGTEHLAFLQPALRIKFLHPSKKSIHLHCPPLLPPLHLLGGLMWFKGAPLRNRLEMLKVAAALLHSSTSKEQQLDRLTVEEWLTKLGQSDTSKKFLWDVITLGALNNLPRNVSALMLFRVLRTAFRGTCENSSLLLPHAGLSEILINPAVDFIRRNGGEVLLGKEALKFNLQDEKIVSVQAADGKLYRAPVLISAIPWFILDRLLTNSGMRSELVIKTPSRELCDWDRFKSSPIISIQVWLDRIVMDVEFAAVLDSRIQWVFNKNWGIQKQLNEITEKQQKEKGQHLSIVISAAQEFVAMTKEELLILAIKDLQRVLPKMKNARIVHSMVLKEKRATFSPIPGLDAIRPLPNTSISNLFLAGDWINTGIPATIEGAVSSGKTAAELIDQLKNRR